MILRWSAASFLEGEAGFRKVMGCCDLWLLDAKLKELAATATSEPRPVASAVDAA